MNDKTIRVYNNVTSYYFGSIRLYDESGIISYALMWNHMSKENGVYLGNLIIHKAYTTEGISEEELNKLEVGEELVKRVLYRLDHKETRTSETISIELLFRRVE